nr:MAG TPA: hypothetical protein [Caudoviricetes sp.]
MPPRRIQNHKCRLLFDCPKSACTFPTHPSSFPAKAAA